MVHKSTKTLKKAIQILCFAVPIINRKVYYFYNLYFNLLRKGNLNNVIKQVNSHLKHFLSALTQLYNRTTLQGTVYTTVETRQDNSTTAQGTVTTQTYGDGSKDKYKSGSRTYIISSLVMAQFLRIMTNLVFSDAK